MNANATATTRTRIRTLALPAGFGRTLARNTAENLALFGELTDECPITIDYVRGKLPCLKHLNAWTALATAQAIRDEARDYWPVMLVQLRAAHKSFMADARAAA